MQKTSSVISASVKQSRMFSTSLQQRNLFRLRSSHTHPEHMGKDNDGSDNLTQTMSVLRRQEKRDLTNVKKQCLKEYEKVILTV